MLSIKGREPFIRMQLWLSDTNNIEKLQTLKNERREANKRRRTNTDTDGIRPPSTRDSPLYNFNSNSGGYSPLSGQSYPSGLAYGQSAAKKPRILFSEEQKEALKLAFSMDAYPTPATIEFLASELGLSVRTITNWFHNHRMRLKQLPTSGAGGDSDSAMNSPAFGMTRDGVTFDTVQFRMSLAQRLTDIRLRGPSHRQEKSKFHAIFGSTQLNTQMYGNPNSCSSPGSSTQGDDDAATLDLSMTSHNNNNRISSSRMFADDSDRSRDSIDDDNSSEAAPLQLDMRLSAQGKTGSSRRKPQIVTSSSSRRKPAQPQWVDPGLEFSGDEDEDDGVDDAASTSEPDESHTRVSPDSRVARREVINGVCVLQSVGEKKAFPETGRKSKSSEDWEEEENDSPSDGEGEEEEMRT